MINKTKQRQYNGVPHQPQRSLVFVAFGIFLLIAGLLLVHDLLRANSAVESVSEPITYTIEQSVEARPRYNQSSFFGPTPDASNTAFLTDLTDTIEAQFNYKFNVSETAKLTYQYQATALIRALHGSDKSAAGGLSPVWSKQYTLTAPVKADQSGTSLTLSPVVSIPFAEYKKSMEQFRKAFSTPTNGELTVTYSVLLTGDVGGTPIRETKESVITVPLDQQIYKLNSKFEKDTRKEILAADNRGLKDTFAIVELAVAILLITAGTVYTVYGLRKHKPKTAYQLEIEKIYRYHDGVIIRAKHPPKLENKDIVVIKNFDDMLNLEDQLKTPIIASKINEITTLFFVSHENTAYVYTVGVPVPIEDKSPNGNA